MGKTGFVVALAFVLTGCISYDAAEKSCTKKGYTPGTIEHQNCAEAGYASRQRTWRVIAAGMGGAASASHYTEPQSMTPIQPLQPMRPAKFLKSSYVSGLNRICIYDSMGSQVVETIPSTSLCPLQ